MSITTRARNILLQPRQEWPVVAAEALSVRRLYLDYILPLAAIGPVASFLGMTMVGIGPFQTSLADRLSALILGYALALLSVVVVAQAADRLAPLFQGRRDGRQALKLAAYSLTPSWLAGIVLLFPALGVLVLVAGLYGVYLLYLGLPALMASPRDRAVPYALSVVAIAVLVQLTVAALAGVML